MMLDRPWPMNSWLPSRSWPLRTAMARAIETASVRASRVTATAPLNRSRRLSIDRVGIDSGGSTEGSAPTVLMVLTPTCCRMMPSTLPPSMAMIIYGQRGRKRRTSTPINSVARETVVT